MCGLGLAASMLKNRIFPKQQQKQKPRKDSGRSSPTDSPRKSSSPHGRVIPPEPVQQRPDGILTDNEAGPALQVHNLARANKLSKKLEWDDRLADDAKKYAELMAETGKIEHSGVENQGENIFHCDGPNAQFEDAVSNWLSGEKKYNGEKIGEGNFEDWGEFAQCLWHSTTHVGMGKGKSKDGRMIIVARYTPPGNVPGGKPF